MIFNTAIPAGESSSSWTNVSSWFTGSTLDDWGTLTAFTDGSLMWLSVADLPCLGLEGDGIYELIDGAVPKADAVVVGYGEDDVPYKVAVMVPYTAYPHGYIEIHPPDESTNISFTIIYPIA